MDKFSEYDKKGQDKAVTILKDIFSNCTLDIEQHIEDKGKVDIIMTATTPKGKKYKYAIECKDRYYPHNQYEDWMLEEHKYRDLMEYAESGYKPIFMNTFSDNTYICWNVSECQMHKKMFTTTKTTVEDNGSIQRYRYMLPTSECTYSGTFNYE